MYTGIASWARGAWARGAWARGRVARGRVSCARTHAAHVRTCAHANASRAAEQSRADKKTTTLPVRAPALE